MFRLEQAEAWAEAANETGEEPSEFIGRLLKMTGKLKDQRVAATRAGAMGPPQHDALKGVPPEEVEELRRVAVSLETKANEEAR